MDRIEIVDNYRRMPDHTIRQIVLYEVRELMPEGVDALRIVLGERGISRDFLVAIDGQLAEFSVEKYSELIHWFRMSKCPRCRESETLLNAATPVKVSSFVFATTESKDVIVGCRQCLLAAVRRALIQTLLLGWWGIPWGLIRTLGAVTENDFWRRRVDEPEPTDEFIAYVYENLGRLLIQRGRDADPFDEPDLISIGVQPN